MPGIMNPTSLATFAASSSALSTLSLPPTTLSFWLYISSPTIQHSLQTVLSTVSIPTKRFTVSSIMTSFAQFQHVIGSIISSADPDATAYFEAFLVEELNLTPQKIERRRASLRNAMVESLTALIIEHTSDRKNKGYVLGSCGRYVHPAVKEAKELLREMADEDDFEDAGIRDLRIKQSDVLASVSSLTENSLVFFLDVEEYVLRSEFIAFKKDCAGPNGKGPHDPHAPKRPTPSLIRYLRVYHDGLLSVDSKQAYAPKSNPNSPIEPLQSSKSSARRLSSTASCRSSAMSYLEKQFLDALQILPQQGATTPTGVAPERRGSETSNYSFYAQYVEKERENEQRRQQTRGIRERKFWDGDWDHEAEFYREALRYDLR